MGSEGSPSSVDLDVSEDGDDARCFSFDGLCNSCDVLGGVAATATGEVEEAFFGEACDVVVHVTGL